MKLRKLMIILILTIFLFSIASVTAANTTDVMTSNDDSSQKNEIISKENEEIIKDGTTGTFADLDDKIRNGGSEITLDKNYTCEDGFYTGKITISKQITIDGQGHTIDAQGKASIFFVNAGNVVLKNIIFKNGKSDFGGAIWWNADAGSVSNCTFVGNSADWYGGAIYWNHGAAVSVSNCTFIDNSADGDGGAIYWNNGAAGSVSGCTFINNSADGDGGAIYWNDADGSVSNCTFVGNSANGDGGAILWGIHGTGGSVSGCTFVGNSANRGGAINTNRYLFGDYCWFGNTAENYNAALPIYGDFNCVHRLFLNATVNPETISLSDSSNITFKLYAYNSTDIVEYNHDLLYPMELIITAVNGNVKSTARLGETLVYTPTKSGTGSVTASIENIAYTKTLKISDGTTFWDLNQTINADTQSEINLINNYTFNPDYDADFVEGIVINRPVTINGNGFTINAKGKARIFFVNSGNVVLKNIIFKNGNASSGGAIFFNELSIGNVLNCSFTNNKVTVLPGYGGAGGAIWMSYGTVLNCNFTDNNVIGNSAWGGAIFIDYFGTVSNCNFINNTASKGGAVVFRSTGNVTNCNFTGNIASFGSAIFFDNYGGNIRVSNSSFLNNRANSVSLEVIKNDNNITITFKGENNLLNAIYSSGDVSFSNVTYWGANGIANTDSSTPVRSNNEAGQNITVKGVVNGNILNAIYTTDEEGKIVLEDVFGDYWIVVCHDTDSYYTEVETISTNMKFYVNVTPISTNNKTVNITAKSNIFNEVMPGKLLFILPNNTEIIANYGDNGIWWAVHNFDDYGVYQINASCIGLDNVTINSGIISIKLQTELSADAIITTYNIDKDLVITLKDSNGNPVSNATVTVDLDGVKTYTTDKNGQVKVSTAGLVPKIYTAKITFAGDNNYNGSSADVQVTVNKAKTQITADAIITTYNIDKDLVITLKDSNGNPVSNATVTVDLDGAKTYTTDKNGQVKVSTAGLIPKIYTAKISFAGDNNYNESSIDVGITVNKATPILKAKKKTYKAKSKTKKFTIVLKDNTGKPIKNAKVRLMVKKITKSNKKGGFDKESKADKKKNFAVTNNKGKATFKVLRNKKGKYNAKVKFYSNEFYNKVTKTVKIVIK